MVRAFIARRKSAILERDDSLKKYDEKNDGGRSFEFSNIATNCGKVK